MDINNKKIEEIITRNKDITNEFLISIMNVELGIHGKTFSEIEEFQKNNNNKITAVLLENDAVQTIAGVKPFRSYGDIFVDSINKMLIHEHRDDLLVKKDETVDNWVQRIQTRKEGDLWVALYANMFSLIKDINDGRVKKIREELRIKGEIKQKEQKQEMQDWLKLIENDPEGLLRQKFLRDYQRTMEGKS